MQIDIRGLNFKAVLNVKLALADEKIMFTVPGFTSLRDQVSESLIMRVRPVKCSSRSKAAGMVAWCS